MHVATILDQAGASIVRNHYWDYGLFATLYQSQRPVPADATLEKVLAAGKADRWAAMLSHVHAHMAALCPATVRAAYVQARLMLLVPAPQVHKNGVM
jgi:Cell morphogenesis central region